MLSLNIQLHSFEFAKAIVSPKDKVRVSITTLPDKQKKAFVFDVSKMSVAHPSFTIEFSEITEEILFVFRKCNTFSSNHIIASTVIKSNEFPELFSAKNNIGMKEMNIYEPIQQASGKKNPQNRKIVGKMLGQFYLDETYIYSNKVVEPSIACKSLCLQQKSSLIDSILNQRPERDNMLFRDLFSN